MPDQNQEHVYLVTEQLARRWQVSPRTLERWRYEGKGPAWTQIGGRVLYSLALVKAYEAAGQIEPETRPFSKRSCKC